MYKLIDSHLHLDDPKFDQLRSEIIQNLTDDGLEFVINNSSDLPSSLASVDLANKYEKIFCAIGCHPHEAKTYDSNFEQKLIRLSQNKKVVAIGEIGLDYYYDLSERSVQRQVFFRQLELADKLALPVTLHVREAWGDALSVLDDAKSYINNKLLVHCFSGSKEVGEILTKKYDAYFSFGGAITFKNYNSFDVIKSVPRDRILTETDSPYLAPIPYRGKVNQPKYVGQVVNKLCEILGCNEQELKKQVRENTLRLFGKIKLKSEESYEV